MGAPWTFAPSGRKWTASACVTVPSRPPDARANPATRSPPGHRIACTRIAGIGESAENCTSSASPSASKLNAVACMQAALGACDEQTFEAVAFQMRDGRRCGHYG